MIGGLLPLVVLVGLYFWISRRASKALAGGFMGIGASKAKVYDQQRPTTRFADVAGYEGAKREISEVVDFLKHPERYATIGAVAPRGVLMVGPPGTGKTLLARAGRRRGRCSVLRADGIELRGVVRGGGRGPSPRPLRRGAQSRARDHLHRRGGRDRPTARRRARCRTTNASRRSTRCWPRWTGSIRRRESSCSRRPTDPRRSTRRCSGPADSIARSRYRCPISASARPSSRSHTRDKHVGHDVDLDAVARSTPGFSGADLANLVNEAAIVAVRDDRQHDPRRRLLRGPRPDPARSPRGNERAACPARNTRSRCTSRVTHSSPRCHRMPIRLRRSRSCPSGQALGVTEQLPTDERHLYSESYLKDSLAVQLGGRAAELLVLGEASSGASSDLAGATDLATRMVREYGMSERLGPVGFASSAPDVSRHRAGAQPRLRGGDPTRDRRGGLGAAARGGEASARLLTEHRAALDRLVDDLIAHETVDGAAVDAALRGDGPSTGPAESGGPLRTPQYLSQGNSATT